MNSDEEGVVVDDLKLVRNINKCLRKTLQKIEVMEAASDRILKCRMAEYLDSFTQGCVYRPKPAESSDSEEDETPATSTSRSKRKKTSGASCTDSILPQTDAVTKDVVATSVPLQCSVSKAVFNHVYSGALPQFFKARVTNIPLSVNMKMFKKWLQSNSVSNYEDVVIFPGKTHKAAVVSYYDKETRDRLIDLDGSALDEWPMDICMYVDPFTRGEDLILAKTPGTKVYVSEL